MSAKAQFCIHGHDTFISGRDKSSGCSQCRRDRDVLRRSLAREAAGNPRLGRRKQRFCVRGHDTSVCGRTKNYGCLICKQETAKHRHEKDPGYRARMAKIQRARDPAKFRRSVRKYKGIQNIPETEAVPGDPCDCCSTPMVKTPMCDHDHATGNFRGWLCLSCNVGLGHIEKPGWLLMAIAYLERAKCKT